MFIPNIKKTELPFQGQEVAALLKWAAAAGTLLALEILKTTMEFCSICFMNGS